MSYFLPFGNFHSSWYASRTRAFAHTVAHCSPCSNPPRATPALAGRLSQTQVLMVSVSDIISSITNLVTDDSAAACMVQARSRPPGLSRSLSRSPARPPARHRSRLLAIHYVYRPLVRRSATFPRSSGSQRLHITCTPCGLCCNMQHTPNMQPQVVFRIQHAMPSQTASQNACQRACLLVRSKPENENVLAATHNARARQTYRVPRGCASKNEAEATRVRCGPNRRRDDW